MASPALPPPSTSSSASHPWQPSIQHPPPPQLRPRLQHQQLPSDLHRTSYSSLADHYTRPTLAAPSFAVHHPLAVENTAFERSQNSIFGVPENRSISVASFSNTSTHSDEPLNPLLKPQQYSRSLAGRRQSPAGRYQQYESEEMRTQAARSLTPQPWHPDYNRDSRSPTPNPLDLPEHRRQSSLGLISGLNEIDLDDRSKNSKNENNGFSKGALNKTRKYISSRLGRKRTRVTYKISGRGRIAQFSNERLYLHWIRIGILQGSIAMTLLNFGYYIAAYIGVAAMVLALMTLIYGTTTFHVRHIYMVTKRNDVVYYERVMPTILCLGLIILYGSNFVLTMSVGEDARSPLPWS